MTLQEKLTDAESAYHLIVTGNKLSVVVDQNGERVEYQRANLSKLAAYIQDLKRQMGQSSAPLRPYF